MHTTIERIRTAPDDPTSPTPVPGALSRTVGNGRVGADQRSGGIGRAATPRSGGSARPPSAGPASGSTRQPTPPRPRPRPLPDPTPSAGLRITGRPARQFQQRWTPSLVVVGGLLVAGLILTVVLLSTLGGQDEGSSPPAAAATEQSVVTEQPVDVDEGPAAIIGARAYDPNGDGTEFDSEVPNLTDGSDTTSWRTECYGDRYMGGQQGVGVVLELSRATTGRLDVTFGATPWAAKIYAADEIPTTMAQWGGEVDGGYTTEDVTSVSFDVGPTPHRYVLVWLTQLASDTGCSGDHPFRGKISEISLVPA